MRRDPCPSHVHVHVHERLKTCRIEATLASGSRFTAVMGCVYTHGSHPAQLHRGRPADVPQARVAHQVSFLRTR
eukprot:7377891-Prymnesium_polylepis.3